MYSGRCRSSKKEQTPQLPFPHVKIKPQLATTIAEMEKEYIYRFNVLFKNRELFASIIQNLSRSLHDAGVDSQRVNQLCSLLTQEHYERSNSSESEE